MYEVLLSLLTILAWKHPATGRGPAGSVVVGLPLMSVGQPSDSAARSPSARCLRSSAPLPGCSSVGVTYPIPACNRTVLYSNRTRSSSTSSTPGSVICSSSGHSYSDVPEQRLDVRLVRRCRAGRYARPASAARATRGCARGHLRAVVRDGKQDRQRLVAVWARSCGVRPRAPRTTRRAPPRRVMSWPHPQRAGFGTPGDDTEVSLPSLRSLPTVKREVGQNMKESMPRARLTPSTVGPDDAGSFALTMGPYQEPALRQMSRQVGSVSRRHIRIARTHLMTSSQRTSANTQVS